MAHIHELRLQIPSELAPSEASSRSSVNSFNSDGGESPLTYKRFSNLVQHSFDGISLSDLIIVKRSDWEALNHELTNEGELHEQARKSIEKTYEEIMATYNATLSERYKEDMEKMAKRVAELESKAEPLNSAVKEQNLKENGEMKLILAGRITDRERVSTNGGQYHVEAEEETSETKLKAEPTVEKKQHNIHSVPLGPRTILRPNHFKNARAVIPTNGSAMTRPPVPRATPGVVSRPSPRYTSPRITTDHLVSDSRSKRRAIYVVNLGPNFSLPALLACITQGALERIIPYPYRGTCLLIFVHSAQAHAFFLAANTPTKKHPFSGKSNANVNWADQAIARMDYYVASRIAECGATRIVKFTGLEAAVIGEGGIGSPVDKEGVIAWWGSKNNYLIGVTINDDSDGRRSAVVECESVRDAWWRVQEVTSKVKDCLLKVGWEWVPDYCASGVVGLA
ncbi:uncharacterized protein H6S33_006184 [Morchella sextelata]|uniref:uncharacterized protein n=1 Tax=Morchella sextelata TaxID=1174677 RepID=UPI001D043C13|nr:uncharacterized protein H6S33_006184 [Morchella sextelata]KAH0614298.1 hypothetical protein H6S33_006184 [Morchella sextelata]